MAVDPQAIHPELPEGATIGSMVRAFAPFTRGRRRIFAVGVVLSLVLFGLAALLPLLTGSLLETALGRANAARVTRDYSGDAAAFKATTADIVRESDLTDEEIALVAQGVLAATDKALARNGDALLNSLFPDGLTYSTAKTLSNYVENAFGSTRAPWKDEVRDLIADGSISRAELEALRGHESGISAADGDHAFNFTVSMLVDDPGAASQRSSARNRDLIIQIVRFGLVVGAVLLLRWITSSISYSFTTWSARRLQDAVFEQVDDSFILDSGALGRPSMISRCTSYVDKVESALVKAQTVGFQAVAGVVLSLALVVWIDVPTGLLMVVVVAIFELVRRLVQGRWSRIGHDRLDANTRLSEVVDDAVTHSLEVRVAGGTLLERARFAALGDRVQSDTKRLGKFGEGFALAALAIGQIGIVIAIAVIGFVRNDLSLAAATATLLYVRTLGESIGAIPGVIVDLNEASPYMRRIERVLLGSKRRPEPIAPPVRSGGDLRLDEVSFTFPDGAQGCSEVSLTVSADHWSVAVGGSGSLRDAVALVASGLEVADSGTVNLGDNDLAHVPVTEIRRHIGVVNGDPVVLAASLRDNLTTLSGPVVDRELLAILERVGLGELASSQSDILDEHFGRDGRRLGPIERARLGLARVIAASPDALVLNDPWLNLELEIQTELWTLVRHDFSGQPVLVVTSELAWIEESDEVLVLSASGVIESGSRSELLTSSARFRKLWDRSTGSGVFGDDLEAIESLSQLSEAARQRLAGQMVTEHFSADDFIYMAGDDEDTLYFVVDGAVVLEDGGRRVATIRRGDHFGDIDRSGAGRRSLSARALTPTVVRRLHRLSVSAGVTGMLERSGMEQKVFRLLTRDGESTRDAIAHIGDGALAALDALVAEGTVVANTDAAGVTTYRSASSQRRSTGVGRSMVSLLDELIAEDPSDEAGD